MRPSESPLFTPAEAAVLTRLSLKAVNNAIDKNLVPAVVRPGTSDSGRFVDQRGLLALVLEYRLANRFFPELRRRLFDALASSPRKAVLSVDEGLVKVDLQQPRRDLAASLRELRRARSSVVTDPDILGGDPVFRGTRVPVHSIAGDVGAGLHGSRHPQGVSTPHGTDGPFGTGLCPGLSNPRQATVAAVA